MATATKLLTAEEFARLPSSAGMLELVRGRVVEKNHPFVRHGEVCAAVVGVLRGYVRPRRLGRVVCNDTGVITQRDPDTVRGPDVAFYRQDKARPGPLPAAYLHVPPDVVFEVLSASDRWADVLEKTAEYLQAGVAAVCLLDYDLKQIRVYYPDRPEQILSAGEELKLLEIDAGFSVPVREFFDV